MINLTLILFTTKAPELGLGMSFGNVKTAKGLEKVLKKSENL